MLRTRLIIGSLLALVAGVVLIADESFAPIFPGLLAIALSVGLLGTRELRLLIPTENRPRLGLCLLGIVAVIGANWLPAIVTVPPWEPVIAAVAGFVLAAFCLEMWTYRGPGGNTARIASAILIVAYLGILPTFFVKLRWLPQHAGVALALAIFVPKCGDIGAYFTGKLLGRTPFSPLLSPKKTWEGIAGGTVTAMMTAIGLGSVVPIFAGGILEAAAFGLVVGWVGVLGDLAESMVKREVQAKDASASVPGFGGVLDVIDSVIFAAPVVYWWLAR